jgi:ribosomal protein L12E/L44/L45/RPP1/RPP2
VKKIVSGLLVLVASLAVATAFADKHHGKKAKHEKAEKHHAKKEKKHKEAAEHGGMPAEGHDGAGMEQPAPPVEAPKQ